MVIIEMWGMTKMRSFLACFLPWNNSQNTEQGVRIQSESRENPGGGNAKKMLKYWKLIRKIWGDEICKK